MRCYSAFLSTMPDSRALGSVLLCPLQYHRDMNKELIAAQTLYASAQRHLVATTPGQGLGVLTRAWCCFELAIRMKVRPQMVSLDLAFSQNARSSFCNG